MQISQHYTTRERSLFAREVSRYKRLNYFGVWKRIFLKDIKAGILPDFFLELLGHEDRIMSRPRERIKKARQRFNNNLKLKQSIIERDGCVCVWCGSSVSLEVDHILTIKERSDLANEPSNLRTLCKKCHKKRHA